MNGSANEGWPHWKEVGNAPPYGRSTGSPGHLHPTGLRGQKHGGSKASKVEHRPPRGASARLPRGKAVLLELQSDRDRASPSGKVLTPEIWLSPADTIPAANFPARRQPNEGNKGRTEALQADRTVHRNHGIAYGWQHLRRQSPRSSPTPGVTPRTWRRRTGPGASNDKRYPYGESSSCPA